ncbi:hypothetical protein HMSSN139_44420 [Paenibacillus sp. HMSSN-139]|nr:hypothetical protein HMSSN139_44420 [Paenibacillus sp. HMSSN-139]
MNNARKGLWLALIVLLTAALSGCGGSGQAQKVKIGEVTRSVFYAPQYVALEKGFSKRKDWT